MSEGEKCTPSQLVRFPCSPITVSREEINQSDPMRACSEQAMRRRTSSDLSRLLKTRLGDAPRSIAKENVMNDRIHELLHRNLQEVFGEGDAVRRRAAIDELYTEDCVLDVPPGSFVGRGALDKFAGDLRATHPHFAYTPHGEPQALHNAGRLAWGLRPTRPSARIHRHGCDHRSRRQDRGALRVPRLHPFIAATALSMIARLIPTRAPTARYPQFPPKRIPK
jgi:hypothetical protein